MSDASGEDTGTAPVEACATQPYCDDNLLVTPSAGRLFCSRETVVCPFGCEPLEGGAACAAFDPTSRPLGAPWSSAATCPYMFKSLCFDSLAAACDCASCGAASCIGGKLKLPSKPDGGGGLPKLPTHVGCQL